MISLTKASRYGCGPVPHPLDRLRVVPHRVLGLGIDGQRAAQRDRLGLGDVDDLLQRQDRVLAVERRRALVARVVGGAADPLLELGRGEVGDGPVVGVVLAVDHQGLEHRLRIGRVDAVAQVLRRAAVLGHVVAHVHQHARRGALARRHGRVGLGDGGDVGVVAQPGVVARDQHAVLGHVDVLLQRVGAGIGRALVRGEGLFGVQAGQSAVADDQRRVAVERQQRLGRGRGRRRGGVVAASARGERGGRHEQRHELEDGGMT